MIESARDWPMNSEGRDAMMPFSSMIETADAGDPRCRGRQNPVPYLAGSLSAPSRALMQRKLPSVVSIALTVRVR